MRRKILRNRARLNMRASGVNKRYALKGDDKARSAFARHWREYAAMPVARTRRRAKAGE